jgi:hypothetical protein
MNVRVYTSPNRYIPGAVILTFADPCPHGCGRYHEHGNPTAETDVDGTYGTRVPHCPDHTHELRADGRRAKLTDRNRCANAHPLYTLVPA